MQSISTDALVQVSNALNPRSLNPRSPKTPPALSLPVRFLDKYDFALNGEPCTPLDWKYARDDDLKQVVCTFDPNDVTRDELNLITASDVMDTQVESIKRRRRSSSGAFWRIYWTPKIMMMLHDLSPKDQDVINKKINSP